MGISPCCTWRISGGQTRVNTGALRGREGSKDHREVMTSVSMSTWRPRVDCPFMVVVLLHERSSDWSCLIDEFWLKLFDWWSLIEAVWLMNFVWICLNDEFRFKLFIGWWILIETAWLTNIDWNHLIEIDDHLVVMQTRTSSLAESIFLLNQSSPTEVLTSYFHVHLLRTWSGSSIQNKSFQVISIVYASMHVCTHAFRTFSLFKHF